MQCLYWGVCESRRIDTNNLYDGKENEINYYPTIKQSWGIVGVSILSIILFGIVHVLLSRIVGEELSFLIYYLLSIRMSFLDFSSEKDENGQMLLYIILVLVLARSSYWFRLE